MSTKAVKPRHGACLCGAVIYEIHGEPLSFRVCHCINCRKATGSAFMSNGFFLRTQVRIVEGQGKLKVYCDKDTASGTPLNRQFCTECGSNVLLSTADPERGKKFIIVALGTLEDEIDWMPKNQLFSEEKRHWVSGIQMDQKPKHKL